MKQNIKFSIPGLLIGIFAGALFANLYMVPKQEFLELFEALFTSSMHDRTNDNSTFLYYILQVRGLQLAGVIIVTILINPLILILSFSLFLGLYFGILLSMGAYLQGMTGCLQGILLSIPHIPFYYLAMIMLVHIKKEYLAMRRTSEYTHKTKQAPVLLFCIGIIIYLLGILSEYMVTPILIIFFHSIYSSGL